MRLDLDRDTNQSRLVSFNRNQRRVPLGCYLVIRTICVHGQYHTAGIYNDTFIKPTRMF
jgi:hypothetical protein